MGRRWRGPRTISTHAFRRSEARDPREGCVVFGANVYAYAYAQVRISRVFQIHVPLYDTIDVTPGGFCSLSLSPFPTLQNLRAAKREWSFSTGESTYQCLSKEDKDGDRQIDTENGWRGERMYNGEKLVPKVAAFSGNPQRFQSSTVFSMLRGRREERGGGGISVK